MSRALGEQDASHNDKFKFVTNAKLTVFIVSNTVANANIRYQKKLARLLTAAVANC